MLTCCRYLPLIQVLKASQSQLYQKARASTIFWFVVILDSQILARHRSAPATQAQGATLASSSPFTMSSLRMATLQQCQAQDRGSTNHKMHQAHEHPSIVCVRVSCLCMRVCSVECANVKMFARSYSHVLLSKWHTYTGPAAMCESGFLTAAPCPPPT